MKKVALLFPGQGSQYVGMGDGFIRSQKDAGLFALADETLGFSLSHVLLQGPLELLTKTDMAQPAILLHSTIAFRALKEKFPHLEFCAGIGHSLGEYSALVAAEVLSISDALKIVHRRGSLMAKACGPDQGAMAAVLGLDATSIKEALIPLSDAKNADYAVVANLNSPEQTVIAGTKSGVEKAALLLKERGAKRIIPLQVSAPFHCELMAPVKDSFEGFLSDFVFNDPIFPIISNVTAEPITNGLEIKKRMLEQITSPVRFYECILFAHQAGLLGEATIELGPKTVLSGLLKKIVPDVKSYALETYDQLTNLEDVFNV